jgi:hypothetical protein
MIHTLLSNILPKHCQSTNKRPYVAGSELKLHSALMTLISSPPCTAETDVATTSIRPSPCLHADHHGRLSPFIPHPAHNELEDKVWGRGLQSSQAGEKRFGRRERRMGRCAWVVTICLCLGPGGGVVAGFGITSLPSITSFWTDSVYSS